jgi:AmmeMemoRadiSam system protein A
VALFNPGVRGGTIFAMIISPEHQQILLHAARTAMVESLRGNRIAIPQTTDPVLNMPAGCFVTLHERGTHRLRGCIGRIQSADPLLKSIYETACSTLEDPRFVQNRVTLDELPRLDLEISILSPLQEAAHPLDFDPPNEGIYLLCAGRAGTFLPQVARETGWTREQLLARLCTEKMGLAPEAWRDPQAKLLKYAVFLIGPVPFIQPRQPATAAAPTGFGAGNTFRM